LLQSRRYRVFDYCVLNPREVKKVNSYQCSECGAAATVVRGDYNFRESGLDYVYLHNIELIACDSCGNQDPIIRESKKLMRNLLIAVASKPEPLEGQDVRFIRKQLGMTQDAFSRLVGTDKTTISKWENNADPIGDQSDLLIRSVAVTLCDEISKATSRKVVEGFKNIAAEHVLKAFCVDAENNYSVATVD
jgi:putative zinc finger/helix-turn-helix YgiT family protein